VPLRYEARLTKDQYDELVAQITSEDFRDPVGQAEGYKVIPHLEVQCNISIAAVSGKTH